METALLEKNRIQDEAAAFDFALEGKTKQKEMVGALRGLKQRRDLAKELGAKGQVKLFDREIVRTERAYRIRHENPYPECNKTDAMDAMCEPIAEHKSPVEKVKGTLNDNMLNSLTSAMRQAEKLFDIDRSQSLRRSVNQLQAYQNAMMNSQMDAMQYAMGSMFANDPLNRGYSRSTHKYDLACETLNLAGLAVEGSADTEVLLPMSALCRLKEAKEKNLFDHFEVWRPAEWKAPDPWLVGVFVQPTRDADGRPRTVMAYYKVCDWR